MSKRLVSLLSLVGALAASIPGFAKPPAEVHVSGPRVRVGDVLPGAPAEVAAIDLGPSPSASGSRLVTREEIVAAAGPAAGKPERLPESVRVVRLARKLAPADVDRITREAIATKLKPGVALARVRPSGVLTVPDGWDSVACELPRPPRRAGRFPTTATLTLSAKDEVLARISVPVELTISKEATVPDLPKGGAVTVVVRRGQVEIAAAGTANADADIGSTLSVSVRASGRTLQARLVEKDRAVALEDGR